MNERLSDAELFIMQCFWQHGALKTNTLSGLVAARAWKPTTLLTFLSRLVNKQALSVQKQGKTNVYSPLITQAQYRAAEGKAFLNEVYGGDVRRFLAAMVNTQGLSATDLSQLKAWLVEQEDALDE